MIGLLLIFLLIVVLLSFRIFFMRIILLSCGTMKWKKTIGKSG